MDELLTQVGGLRTEVVGFSYPKGQGADPKTECARHSGSLISNLALRFSKDRSAIRHPPVGLGAEGFPEQVTPMLLEGLNVYPRAGEPY